MEKRQSVYVAKIKQELSKSKKGFIFDVALIGLVMVVATIVMVLLAYTWSQFVPQLNAMNSQGQFPLNASTQAKIDSIGNTYYYNSAPSLLILLFGVMVVCLFISAWGEASGIIAFPLGIIFLIGALFMSFLLSDFAHNLLSSAPLGVITNTYYSAPLYLLNNLPIITGILGVGYLIFIMLHRNSPRLIGQNMGGYGGGRLSGG